MTDRSLQETLLERYAETQARTASGAIYDDLQAPWPYYDANYAEVVDRVPRDGRILEIGCGHGSLLAWLRARGWEHIEGVDASPGEVAFANAHLGGEIVALGDAHDILRERAATYDLVLAKAILEHVPKPGLLPLVSALAGSLRPGGTVVIDVPNMDWLLATHERYMDLTHEVGFTRESLRTLLSLCFADVEIRGSRLPHLTRSQRLFRPLLLRVLRRALYVLGEGANDFLFANRSLIAVARMPLPAR